jgi:UDP-N-acetylglucosamine 2-epimerase
MVAALDSFPDRNVIFTKANADTGGEVINAAIDTLVASRSPRYWAVASLGLRRYLSAMKLCDAVIGNSSSGILEAPAFRVPTVNIGDRQKGRVRVQSVLDCEATFPAIRESIALAINVDFRQSLTEMANPFEQANTASRIVETLAQVDLQPLLKKEFYNLKGVSH